MKPMSTEKLREAAEQIKDILERYPIAPSFFNPPASKSAGEEVERDKWLTQLITPTRRHDKALKDKIKVEMRKLRPKINGYSFNQIILDEFGDLSLFDARTSGQRLNEIHDALKVEKTFESEDHPDIKVQVCREKRDKRDPRNPNPHARGARWIIRLNGERTSQEFSSRHKAITFAGGKFKSLVDEKARLQAIKAAEKLKRRAMNENFGRF